MNNLIAILTQKTNLKPHFVHNILNLLEEGSTIPFIARYRKEMTGAASDEPAAMDAHPPSLPVAPAESNTAVTGWVPSNTILATASTRSRVTAAMRRGQDSTSSMVRPMAKAEPSTRAAVREESRA